MMQQVSSALGDFTLIDNDDLPLDNSLKKHTDSPYHWKPRYWAPWPLPKDYQLPNAGWTRPPQQPIKLTGVNVIDVEHGRILPDMTVKIRQGFFERVSRRNGNDDKFDIQAQPEWMEIDCKGLYMCPGLIDCHVHILAEAAGEDGWSDIMAAYRVAHDLKGMLGNGFTTIRDVGGATRHHREATEQWLIPGPRLYIGGPVLSQTGGHGDHSDRDAAPTPGMISDGNMGPMSIIVDGVDACLKAARKLMMAGADHIKICSSGGVLSPTDKVDSDQFTVPEIKAICDTVRSMGGTLVTAHCNTTQGARNAIEAGVMGIEHGSLIDEPTLKLMAEKGVHLTPTLIVQEMIVNGPLGAQVPKVSLEKAKVVAGATYEMIKIAHRVGVNIAYGTDIIVDVQLSEFDLRATILPSPVILKQATCNGAKVLGMKDKLGCIKEGAFADFLLLDANPLEDIKILNRPDTHLKAVVKDGRCVRSTVAGLEVEIPL
ncbi:amidohydrolase [Naematelia encephala]|uniref:Amidohydrolase n=1 Tax=Naematelia encephala TaxID=71784 RepID=A0A1Y2ARH2_9TREE|nr:amidohydrolase [Naematelia encephala]